MVLFRVGKAIGIAARLLFVFGLFAAVAVSVAEPNTLFVLSFGAGPVLLFLGLAEAVARYLMRIGGAEQEPGKLPASGRKSKSAA